MVLIETVKIHELILCFDKIVNHYYVSLQAYTSETAKPFGKIISDEQSHRVIRICFGKDGFRFFFGTSISQSVQYRMVIITYL